MSSFSFCRAWHKNYLHFLDSGVEFCADIDEFAASSAFECKGVHHANVHDFVSVFFLWRIEDISSASF